MVIHRVEAGENLHTISRKYGVSPAKIIENNALASPDKLSVGKELLILTPTKTYTVRGGDTLDGIARRFDTTERELKRCNPYLSEKRITYPEQVIAIKHDTPSHGAVLFNGYYYRDTPRERLRQALATSDIITVSAYTVRDGKLKRIFNDSPVLDAIKESGKEGVMRIYTADSLDTLSERRDPLAKDIVKSAKEGGYRGISLSAWRALEDKNYLPFFEYLKECLNSESLYFTVECDRAITGLSQISDRAVLQYEKLFENEIPSFEDGEKKFYGDYAKNCEASRTFLDLPSLGYIGDEGATESEIDALAYRLGKEIYYDEKKKICYFDIIERGRPNESKRVAYESLENTKAKLSLVSSLGFMGISFDIMRIPIKVLMMAVNTFADTYSASGEI